MVYVLRNAPIRRRYLSGERNLMFGISWKTLSCRSYTPDSEVSERSASVGDPVTRHSHRLSSSWERLSLVYIGRLLSTKHVTKDHGRLHTAVLSYKHSLQDQQRRVIREFHFIFDSSSWTPSDSAVTTIYLIENPWISSWKRSSFVIV